MSDEGQPLTQLEALTEVVFVLVKAFAQAQMSWSAGGGQVTVRHAGHGFSVKIEPVP